MTKVAGVVGFKIKGIATCPPELTVCCPNALLTSRIKLQLFWIKS